MPDVTPLADLPAEWEAMADALTHTLAARLGTADGEMATLRICAQQVRDALATYDDLRAAVEALADRAEAKAPSAMRSGGVAIVTTAELRALLATAPASETARGWCSVCYEAHPTCIPAPTPPTTVQADRDTEVPDLLAALQRSVTAAKESRATNTTTTDEPECPHGHRLPENCGLCTGCDS